MELTERLYVSDVDGTLFENGEPKISEEGAELFRKLVKRGIAFTIASGRNLYGVYDLAQECGITLPVIAYNGSAIYDFQKGKMLRYFAMEQTAVARLCGLFDGANLPFKACVYFKNQERCLTFNQNGYRSSLWTDRAVHPKSGLLADSGERRFGDTKRGMFVCRNKRKKGGVGAALSKDRKTAEHSAGISSKSV